MRGLVRAAVALGFLLLLVVIAVCAVPAGVVAWYVAHETDGAIVLADAQGSLRTGRARVTDGSGRWSVPINWTLDVGSLWQGAVTVRFGATPSDPIRGSLRLARDSVEANNVDATVPAAIAALWLPPVIALSAGGNLALTAPAFRLGETPQGHATARWSPARLADASANVIDFGDLGAQVDAHDGQIVITLASTGGDTALAGEIRVAGERVDADVTLTPRTSTPSPLLRGIAAFGTAAPGGGTHFSYHGAWRNANR